MWFEGSSRRRADYFGAEPVGRMARRLHEARITEWFVHAGPATPDGFLPELSESQSSTLVDANARGSVLAWVGGVVGKQAFPARRTWRDQFASSCRGMVDVHGLAGVHINIEPCTSFEEGYLETLEAVRVALPSSRISVAAYPPPTLLHPFPSVHWNADFYGEVSARCDDIAVMAYDTALRFEKAYAWLVRTWANEVVAWSSVPVRLGLPAYEDDVGYHDPDTESLEVALAGLAGVDPHPQLVGWAVNADWTLDDAEHELLIRCGGNAGPE